MANDQNNPAKEILTDCTLCYHSCGTKITVENGKAVMVQGLESHPLNRGALCPKGKAALDFVYSPERLTDPLKKVNGEFVKISWEQALDEISAKLGQIKNDFGPEQMGVFSGSIGVENLEMAGLVQRFKGAYGSPNFFSVESVCYRMRIRSRQITFGKYPTEELDSKLYILWGHNPEQSDFPLKMALERNLMKGSGLVVIDPKRIPLAEKADTFLRIRPGTDTAMALAMINAIIGEGLQDQEYIDKHTIGFHRLAEHIRPFTPEWAEAITWVPAGEIRKLARRLASTKGAGIYQGTCTQDQTASGTQASRAFAILQVITGNINVPGGWVVSPRLKFGYTGLMAEGDPLGAKEYPLFFEVWGRTSPYGVVTLVPQAIPEKLKAFLVFGGNPLVSMPDTNAFTEAFRRLELLVVHDLVMSETAKEAHYVLPAASHLEKWGVAYTYNVCHCMPYLMLRKKCIEPIGQSRSEWWVLTELAKRLGFGDQFPWQSEEELVSFELMPTGLPFEYLLNEKPEGDFYQQKQYGTPEGLFRSTPSGKIEIFSEAIAQVGYNPLPEYTEPERGPNGSHPEWARDYPLILSTGARNLYYTHSQHRSSPALKQKNPEPMAEIGPKTAGEYGVSDGGMVVISTNRGQVRMKAKVEERLAEGMVAVPHGWGGQANANLLTDVDCREGIMGYPDLKSLQCSIRPVEN